MPKACCVPKCKNYYGKDTTKKYHIFPRDEALKNEWMRVLKIKRKLSTHDVICSSHFTKSDYNISNDGNKFVLRKGRVPSKNIPNCKAELDDDDSMDVCGMERCMSSSKWYTILDTETGNFMLSREENLLDTSTTSHTVFDSHNCDIGVKTSGQSFSEIVLDAETGSPTTSHTVFDSHNCDIGVETSGQSFSEINQAKSSTAQITVLDAETGNFISNIEENRDGDSEERLKNFIESGYLNKKYHDDKSVTVKPDYADKGIQTSLPGKRTSYIALSDNDLLYFTGLERERFEIVYSILEKFNPIEDSMLWCRKDALVITLHKCRHNVDFHMMEWIFELDRKFISEIFKEVIGKLYIVLKQIDIWQLSIKDPKLYRCILDCTEFFVVRAGDPTVHQLTYSYYKSHPTFKLLVSCDEMGAVNFISEAFVGSISDREIVIKSGLLEKVEKDDAILADKGFDVSDLFEGKGVTVNIPPFLRGKEQLSDFEVMKTRIIANRRILIENINCRAKKNKIIATTMQKCLWPLANKIIYVCFALVNFYKPLKDEKHI